MTLGRSLASKMCESGYIGSLKVELQRGEGSGEGSGENHFILFQNFTKEDTETSPLIRTLTKLNQDTTVTTSFQNVEVTFSSSLNFEPVSSYDISYTIIPFLSNT